MPTRSSATATTFSPYPGESPYLPNLRSKISSLAPAHVSPILPIQRDLDAGVGALGALAAGGLGFAALVGIMYFQEDESGMN